MLKVITLPVGQLATNCYLVIDKDSPSALIIDPGDDADYIERIIADKKCKPSQIIATHGHFDHLLAAFELRLAYNIPFRINKKDEFLVKKMKTNARYFLGINVDPPPKIDGYIKEGEIIKAGKSSLIVLETPGHTPGSISLYSEKEKILFSGDLLFAQGVGRTDFSYSSEEKLKESLARISKLPAGTNVYPGHGEPFAISG